MYHKKMGHRWQGMGCQRWQPAPILGKYPEPGRIALGLCPFPSIGTGAEWAAGGGRRRRHMSQSTTDRQTEGERGKQPVWTV